MRRRFAQLRGLVRRIIVSANGFAGRSLRPRIIFLGDSITEFWSEADPMLFRPGRINAGCSGETTAQMRARFERDVIARRPAAVHIMGGTNDLWHGYPGRRAADTLENIAAMTRAADAQGIRVVLAPPPPIVRAAEAMFGHPELFANLRAAIAEQAASGGHILVDYAESLTDEAGELRPAFTTDGVHLTRAGYRAMRGQAQRAIAASRAARVRRFVPYT